MQIYTTYEHEGPDLLLCSNCDQQKRCLLNALVKRYKCQKWADLYIFFTQRAKVLPIRVRPFKVCTLIFVESSSMLRNEIIFEGYYN